MLIGIVGLPNSSKTTVFNALTRGHAETAAFGGARVQVERASVEVPDPRFDRLVELFSPKKTTRARVEYLDIAGLAKGIDRSGLSGELTNAISQNDALLHVVRAFEDDEIPHPEDSIDPSRDVDAVDSEFLLSDLVKVERRLEKLEDSLRKPGKGPERDEWTREQALLTRLHVVLEEETPLRDVELEPDEMRRLRGYQFLSAKPILILLNTGDDDVQDPTSIMEYDHPRSQLLTIRGQLEMELAQLEDEADRAELLKEFGIAEPGLDRVIRASYGLLGLQVFFTVGEDEVRAWTIPVGATAAEAAGAIHSDLQRGFIRAEVTAYDDLIAAGSIAASKSAATTRTEGKDYLVKDGDVMNIRFNV